MLTFQIFVNSYLSTDINGIIKANNLLSRSRPRARTICTSKLENILNLKSSDTKQEDLIASWRKFYQGGKDGFAQLKKMLNLTHGDDKIKELIELAHYNRFPTKEDSSGMSEEECLTRCSTFMTQTVLSNIHSNRRGRWSERLREYHNDLEGILKLESFGDKAFSVLLRWQNFIKWFEDIPENVSMNHIWATISSSHEPSGSSATSQHNGAPLSIRYLHFDCWSYLSGKSRLIVELTEHVCVVYVCIRPRGSTDQPPRSQIADLMLPATALKLDMDNQLHAS
ncbi:hypothetical protein KEM48_002692 [Puccinia striiformis f. sp. tritici PST-130]|nr:hypothetical protein KEM48_002692 [Puccinia striiformis f. sp. tritici PST-130]